ncbi:MAG: Holliday junction resolvase RecU [Tuberibacillus sp.]
MVIHYPNGKPYHAGKDAHHAINAAPLNYGNRGMTLEEDLNATNQYYRENHIAVIHKKPTPVQIVNVDYPKRSAARITEAYFKKPSTTDYNGVYKGKYIDFEAKETRNHSSLPLQNFHPHQIDHMSEVKAQGGIAFIIVKFTTENEIYLLDAEVLFRFWKDSFKGGRKSIPKQTFIELGSSIKIGYAPRIPYLDIVDLKYLKTES